MLGFDYVARVLWDWTGMQGCSIPILLIDQMDDNQSKRYQQNVSARMVILPNTFFVVINYGRY